MSTLPAKNDDPVSPKCAYFYECGGCSLQDISYSRELDQKQLQIETLFEIGLGLKKEKIEQIIPSPSSYHYRHRLNLNLRRLKTGEYLFGFSGKDGKKTVPIDSCPIAQKELSDFLPELKQKALERIPSKYKTANIVVKRGDDGRILWGGIGRRSLCLKEEDYLWAEIDGVKIHSSLDTFFQANLLILPLLKKKLETIIPAGSDFYDLYGGVGFFTFLMLERIRKGWIVEGVPASVELARYNVRFHRCEEKVQVMDGPVEQNLESLLFSMDPKNSVIMVDPPRKGLFENVAKTLSESDRFQTLVYLSCNPHSQVKDLSLFLEEGWTIESLTPFDFFPRTDHIESLALLSKT